MKIHNKVFATIFLFSFALIAVMVGLIRWSIDKGMVDYVNTRELEVLAPMTNELVQYYRPEQQWQSLQGRHRVFTSLLRDTLQGSEFSLPKPERIKRPLNERRPPPHRLKQERKKMPRPSPNNAPLLSGNSSKREMAHYALLDRDKNYVVGSYPSEVEYGFLTINYREEVVGFLAVSKRSALTKGYELDFIEQQNHILWLIAICAMLMVFFASIPLARHVVEPIRRLTTGMHQLTQGQYQQKITVKRKDELGQLSRDFNELALTLSQNESARKRWLANISHELRTPVAILRGELEAIMDGVRPLTMEQIASAHQETEHLARLINDLQALTIADIGGMSYRKEKLDIVELLNQESGRLSTYLAAANLTLKLSVQRESLRVYADKTRLSQLFENLVNNCLKYASTGTQVKISLQSIAKESKFHLVIEDDGCGVEDEHLPHLFEHLYRVENSRNRNLGGSGLGLSICNHIVTAHGGEITAKRSAIGGLAIVIALPTVV